MVNARITFVGDIPPPATGQAVAFHETYKGTQAKEKRLFLHNIHQKKGVAKIIATLFVIIRYFGLIFFSKKSDIIYFTGSRSLSGGFKDLFLINWAKWRGIKLVNHVHGTDLPTFLEHLPWLMKGFFRRAYRRVDCHIVLLEEMKEALLPYIKEERLQVVYNFYDVKLDEEWKVEKQEEEIQLLYLSNLIHSKGIVILLDAFAQIHAEYPNLRLKIAGNYYGDEHMDQAHIQKTVECRLDSLPSNKVSYLGPQYGDDKYRLLYQSDIFVLPTFYKMEAFPLSILEAMRAENYILTTQHNLLPSIVKEENGSCIKANSVGALVDELRMLLDDISKVHKSKKYNAIDVQRRYSFGAYMQQIHAIFERVGVAKK